jgi:hypothetical protein
MCVIRQTPPDYTYALALSRNIAAVVAQAEFQMPFGHRLDDLSKVRRE